MSNFNIYLILTFILSHHQCVAVDIKFIPDERLSDCEDLPSFKNLLDVNITYDQISDDTAEVNGVAILRPELKSHLPVSFLATSEYLDRGSWIPGPGFASLDACKDVANPKAAWYSLYKALVGDPKRCPFRAGDVFHLEKYQFKTIIHKVNSIVAGQWKVKSVLSQVGIGHSKKFCCIGKFSLTLV